jgi:hypothetical protein
MSQLFAKRTVEKSFRKFNDIANDLTSAAPQALKYKYDKVM